ncbi:FAD-dependent oxidoreductase, partial [bacterium]|nr:FAD-dependent oxidoreductase [bacterium]
MTHQNLTIHLPDHLPIRFETDVLVAGGGPGGIGAAVAAAREGAKVLLVEHYGFLGGMATAGEVNPFMPNHLGEESLDQGIFEEWLDRMRRYGGVRPHGRVFDPNAARLAAEDLCVEAGVSLLYHHTVVHAETEGRQISGLALHGKGGFVAARAVQYIDSTGDGDLAALAGCDFEYGAPDSGQGQPMTLCFKLKLDPHVFETDAERENPFQALRSRMAEVQQIYLKAQAEGRIDCPRENVLIFPCVDELAVHFNPTRVIHRSS